jgi:hypothetical protein
MATYNAKPKPRALLINFDDQEIAESNIPAIFPTYKNITEAQLGDVRVAEYDVAIVAEASISLDLSSSTHLVFLGGECFSPYWKTVDGMEYIMGSYQESVATEYVIEDDLGEDLIILAKNLLLPVLQDSSRKSILSGIDPYSPGMLRNIWQPIVNDPDGNVLVGYVRRHPSHMSEQWYLPPGIKGKALGECLRILMRRWAMSDPETFSVAEDWHDDSVWQSSAEQDAKRQISNEEEKFRQVASDHMQKIAEMRKTLEAASKKADSDHRVLLTQQGDELKDKVSDVLSIFGFDVTNADEQATKGDLLEDLRVEAMYKGRRWVALVEVRGYKRGAQLNDLLRISGRFLKRYMQENGGAIPDALWYVVNHDIETPPGKRQNALSSNKKEVQTFAEDSLGLVVDTTTLFQLRTRVEDGSMTPDEARELLISSTGYFEAVIA